MMSHMIHWWQNMSFSQAGLWLLLIVGIIALAATLCRPSRQNRLLPPDPRCARAKTESVGTYNGSRERGTPE